MQLLEQSFADPNPKQKGVLTVDLKKVMKLAESCDSYVVLRLYDPHRLPVPDVEVKTKVELNESSPRYNFKTDFVNISGKCGGSGPRNMPPGGGVQAYAAATMGGGWGAVGSACSKSAACGLVPAALGMFNVPW